jgi:hypothetical protein
MPAAIFQGSEVKTLKDQLNIGGATKILTGTDDPTSVAKDAPLGSKYIKTDTGGWYRKLDAGSSTNWELDTSEFKSADSATKTPAATQTWLQMTGNSVVLTPGSWLLTGAVQFTSSGGAAGYTSMQAFWALANGDDTATTPSFVTPQAGLGFFTLNDLGSDLIRVPMSTIRYTVAVNTTVYLVPITALATATNARVTTHVYAERVS